MISQLIMGVVLDTEREKTMVHKEEIHVPNPQRKIQVSTLNLWIEDSGGYTFSHGAKELQKLVLTPDRD